jgi:hypothetical protein
MHPSARSLCRGLLTAAVSVAATALASAAAGSFEGRVEMKMTYAERGGSHVIEYAIKEGKLRLNFPRDESGGERGGGAGAMIVDYGRHETLILMEMPGHDGGAPQKMFMRRPLPQANEASATAAKAEATASEPVPTGRTEMIAGYLASEYRLTGRDGEVTELWLTKGLGAFMFPNAQSPMGRGRPTNASPVWERLVRDGGFFPLRVISHGAGGAEKMRLDVTKIEKTSLPDSMFTAEGYSEFQMPNLGGLPGGMNPFKR